MGTFIRAVVTGFGFSLGSALYKKVSKRLGLEEGESDKPPPDDKDDGEGEREEDSPEPAHESV